MKHRHVFITGATNSGTGFLRYLMTPHPQLSMLQKEGQHYCKILPSDNRLKLKRRLFALYPEIYRWTKEHLDKVNVIAIKNSFYKKWDLSKPILGEKSPHHMVRLEFWSEVFKPAKFVGIVRNGFAVAEGIRRRRSHDISECAFHWNRAHEIMIADLSKVDLYLMKYEDLISCPQEEMNKVFEFLGVEPIKVKKNKPIPRQNIMGKNKFYSLSNAPLFNEESMKRLSEDDKDIILKVARPMLEHFGYA